MDFPSPRISSPGTISAANWESLNECLSRSPVDHLGFLRRLCELKLVYRERRASDRRLKATQLPLHKTLERFDFKAQPSLNKLRITELQRRESLDRNENSLLVGNSGAGKSHIATAWGIDGESPLLPEAREELINEQMSQGTS